MTTWEERVADGACAHECDVHDLGVGSEGPGSSMSTRVEVLDPESGRTLFTGRLADTESPWVFWTRVVPDDGPVDLPPKYKVRRLGAVERGAP